MGGNYIDHTDLNSNHFTINNEHTLENPKKDEIVKNIIYNLCGFIFDKTNEKRNKITIIDESNIKDKYFDKLKTCNYDKLIESLKYQIVLSMYFEINTYHLFNSIYDNDNYNFNEKLFIDNVKKLMKIPEKDYNTINASSIESYIKSHVNFFLFFFIEKRKHYVDNNFGTDMNNLSHILKQLYPDLSNKIDSDFANIIKCVKENIELLNGIRTEFFAQTYKEDNKDCFIFFCNACCTRKCKEDQDDDNSPEDFFVLFTCGHSMHRDCARGHSKSNNKSAVLTSLSTKYIKCALCAIECPICRHISFIYY